MSTTVTAATAPQRLDRMLVLMWGIGGTAAVVILALSSALGATLYQVPVLLALGLGLAQAAAILLAIVIPRVATALSVVAVIAFALASTPDGVSPWPVAVTSIVAQALVILIATVRSSWRTGVAGWAAGAGGAFVVGITALRAPGSAGAVTADLIVFTAITGVVLLAALLLTQWQAVRRQLAREQQVSASELARREIAEERTRIARELHDVVAHGMSAIQVQASSARYRIPSLSEEAAGEFDDLAATARSAMGEMRRLLGVLRSEDTVVETAPQPGVGDVEALVERASRAGSQVRLENRVAPADSAALDPALSLTVYRIVQESLSNVARHATGAPTLVLLDARDGEIDLEVRNEAPAGRPASAPAPDSGGHGIRGMRERAALLDGSLEAARTDDGGFAVRASFPIAAAGASARGTE
jgi:signal transduction histidine kinase